MPSSASRCLLLAGLLALVALAGCAEEGLDGEDEDRGRIDAFPPLPDEPLQDFSLETLDVTVEAEDAYRVGLPLPVSGNVTTAADWARNVTVWAHGENPLVEARETDNGPVLVVEGAQTATLRSVVLEIPQQGNRCCAEAFLDAEWSTADEDERPRLWVDEGRVDVSLRYEATSNFCSSEASLDVQDLEPGWTRREAGFSALCQ